MYGITYQLIVYRLVVLICDSTPQIEALLEKFHSALRAEM